MIVELCGIPGAGKSSLVDVAARKKRIVTRSELLGKKSDSVLLRKINSIQKEKRIKQILSNAEHPLTRFCRSFPDAEDKYIHRLIHMYICLQRTDLNSKICLLEEGPLQYLSSIAHDKPLKKTDELVEAVKMMAGNIHSIFACDCPIPVAAERIAVRKKNGDRFYRDDLKEIEVLLERKANNLALLEGLFPNQCIRIDMTADIEENADRILNLIEKEDD